ncbi:MAG: Abi family protein [Desulfuromonas sp.]|nr:Abi family protein [Desulfuromonas sp.]
MTAQVKPWKSIDAQLEILRTRGLQIEDNDRAKRYLTRLGYYRLGGYWYPFRQFLNVENGQTAELRHDDFMEGSRFGNLVDLYVFDKKLRLLALDALERIEMALRVDVAHLLGERDALAHENADCFHGNFGKKINQKFGKTGHQIWLEKYQQQVRRAGRTPFVSHHLGKYDSLPIWAAIEVWDFGMLSTLYEGMKYNDKKRIALKYNVADGNKLAKYLRSLNFIRNVSAHHARLWNVNVVDRSPLPQGQYWQQLNNARPFFYFCLMQMFLRVISPTSTWGQRLITLLNEDFPVVDCDAINVGDFGVVGDWRSWELWP